MKTIVIPDLHNEHRRAIDILDKHYDSSDEIILLGDYFDNFNDSHIEVGRTAYWLSDILKESNIIALIGNHELNYIHGSNKPFYQCSGYSQKKGETINGLLSKSDWGKMKLAHFSQGIWFTHAGISTRYLDPINGFTCDGFKNRIGVLEEAIKTKNLLKDFQAGITRGGEERFPGFLWCDFNEEFKDIGIGQIFGHTPLNEPGVLGHAICLDTKSTDKEGQHHSLNYYAIIIDGEVEIKRVE